MAPTPATSPHTCGGATARVVAAVTTRPVAARKSSMRTPKLRSTEGTAPLTVTQGWPRSHCTLRPRWTAQWLRHVGRSSARNETRKETDVARVRPRSRPGLIGARVRPCDAAVVAAVGAVAVAAEAVVDATAVVAAPET